MTEAIVTRAQKLYREAGEVVAKEVKLKEQSGRHIVRLASILKDLYEIFLQREDPHESSVMVPTKKGLADSRECMVELLRPLDLHERMGWSYVSIGRHLLGKIPEAVLADMPFEKVKQPARVAKAKTDLPAELIERAKDPEEPAAILREEVDIMLYGAPPTTPMARSVVWYWSLARISSKLSTKRLAVFGQRQLRKGPRPQLRTLRWWTSPWPTACPAFRRQKITKWSCQYRQGSGD
jgi:hypothetical protein